MLRENLLIQLVEADMDAQAAIAQVNLTQSMMPLLSSPRAIMDTEVRLRRTLDQIARWGVLQFNVREAPMISRGAGTALEGLWDILVQAGYLREKRKQSPLPPDV